MENNKFTKTRGNNDSEGDSSGEIAEDVMEESEGGVEVRSSQSCVSPILGRAMVNSTNNVNISRSSSSISLVSNSQTDDVIRNNYHADDVAKSDDSEVALEEVEKVLKRNLPSVDVVEKIILCLDITQDPDFSPFKLADGTKHNPLTMVKRVTEIFLRSKNIINGKHEFALVVMENDSVLWVRDFTSDPNSIISVIEDVNDSPQSGTFDLTQLFDTIKSHVTLPVVDDPIVVPPPFVIRTVLLYSRSYCLPEFKHGRDSFDYLISSQYFTLDILYIHEDPSENNKCEEVFKVLDGLDEKGLSYVFDVPRNATKLHHDMAKLLAHPLQRPAQKSARYKLELAETQ